jgi:uncharacterized protein (DUF1810 family)
VAALDRFRDAQDEDGIFERALEELRAGAKRSHWMWFVFPQLAGLGHSAASRRYAIRTLGEARDYLADPVLGARLRDSAAALLVHDGPSAEQIRGGIDALKLRSSMTLFARADPGEPLFRRVLEHCFGGQPDPETDALLAPDA